MTNHYNIKNKVNYLRKAATKAVKESTTSGAMVNIFSMDSGIRNTSHIMRITYHAYHLEK